ncbi:hypothetical protein PMIT1306_00550 [Prochlorococcus sp. MIT 1306]|nr:hypothetical protein PMIT1306_00550 [Prochlorococcus sp. MIT 1306]
MLDMQKTSPKILLVERFFDASDQLLLLFVVVINASKDADDHELSSFQLSSN